MTCSSRQLLSRLADKWVTLVLCALVDGTTRHSALARRVSGVSQKRLTQTLPNLERDGLVARTVTPTVPIKVEYELTPRRLRRANTHVTTGIRHGGGALVILVT